MYYQAHVDLMEVRLKKDQVMH